MINRISKILEKYGVLADVDYEVIAEEIEFEFQEYTNFINQKYKPFADDWIRRCDDKIISNPNEIIEDYINSKTKQQ